MIKEEITNMEVLLSVVIHHFYSQIFILGTYALVHNNLFVQRGAAIYINSNAKVVNSRSNEI